MQGWQFAVIDAPMAISSLVLLSMARLLIVCVWAQWQATNRRPGDEGLLIFIEQFTQFGDDVDLVEVGQAGEVGDEAFELIGWVG